VGVQVKLWNPLRTRAIHERFCGGDSLQRGAISSVCTFYLFTGDASPAAYRCRWEPWVWASVTSSHAYASVGATSVDGAALLSRRGPANRVLTAGLFSVHCWSADDISAVR